MTIYIRTVAIVAVLYSATMLGATIARNYRERPRHLRLMQFALQMMETEINYGATPLPDIWRNLAHRIGEPINGIFAQAHTHLNQGTSTISESFDWALQEGLRTTALLSTDMEILRTLSSTLGRSNREEQMKSIRLAQTELAIEETKAEQERQNNEKMWRYLGFLIGMALVVILV